MFQAYRIVTYTVKFALTQPLRHLHKLAYAEFVQDGGRQLKFRVIALFLHNYMPGKGKNTKLGIP